MEGPGQRPGLENDLAPDQEISLIAIIAVVFRHDRKTLDEARWRRWRGKDFPIRLVQYVTP